YAPGDIASRDVKAPRDLLIPDLPLTEKKRLEAEEAVLPLYDYDPRTGQEIAERLVQSLQRMTVETEKGSLPETLHKEVETILGVSLTGQEFVALGEMPSDPSIQGDLRKILSQALNQKIVGN